MKTVNDSIKRALAKPTTTRKGRILVDDTYYEVYNVIYYAEDYDEGRVIGNAISTQLDFDVPYMQKFDKFKYYDGILTENGFEYVDMGTFTVFDDVDNDEFTKHITAFDNLINFNALFVPKNDYPKTLYQELQNICQQAGVELENETIVNGDFIVEDNQFVAGESLKTILKAIISLSGDIAIIKDDKLKLLLETDTDFEMDKSYHEPMDWKRRSYGINQVIIGDSQIEGEYVTRRDDEDIAVNGVHKLTIYDNPFAYTEDKRDALIDGLFNKVKGFGYLPYELKGEWINFLEVGDLITIDGNKTRVLRINGKSPNALDSEMSAPAIIDSAIEFLDNTDDVKNQLKRTERIVDKQNQVIQDTVELVEGQNDKISQVTQTVDEIQQKIENIADLTIDDSSIASKIKFTDIYGQEPLNIIIHPINEHIDITYPTYTIYPSDNTFTRARSYLKITNSDGSYDFEYDLPELLYLDENTYDELEIDYESHKCFKTKNVEFNEQGKLSKLEPAQVIEYDYPDFGVMPEGDYTLEILDGYLNAYIYAKFVMKNDYTDLFATKKELRSAITQTEEKIESEVQNVTKLFDEEVENLSSRITQTATDITTEVNQTKTDLQGEIETLSSTVTQTADSLTSEINKKVDTTTFNSRIQQTENKISSKVDQGDFGSLVQQYYNKVLVGFNNASSVIQLATNGISLYRSGSLRVSMGQYDIQFYQDGYHVGDIGTGYYQQDSSQKSLTFNLDSGGKYMGWFQRDSSSGPYYASMYYARAGAFGQSNAGIHFSDNVYGHGWSLSGFNMAASIANEHETINNKSVPIVTDVSIDDNGNLNITKSSINVRSGMITAVPDSAIDIS